MSNCLVCGYRGRGFGRGIHKSCVGSLKEPVLPDDEPAEETGEWDLPVKPGVTLVPVDPWEDAVTMLKISPLLYRR